MPLLMAAGPSPHSVPAEAPTNSQPDFAKTGNALIGINFCLFYYHHRTPFAGGGRKIVRHINNINAGNFHHLLLVINIFNR